MLVPDYIELHMLVTIFSKLHPLTSTVPQHSRYHVGLRKFLFFFASANTSSNQVDLFGESLVDLMDAPTSSPTESATFKKSAMPEVDLFADATFVSASPHPEATTVSHDQANVDLFASQPAFPASVSTSVDLFGAADSVLLSSEPKNTATFDPFAAPDPGMRADTKSSTSEPTNTKTFDPFAASPLSNFEESDSFGAFTSNTESATTQLQKNVANSLCGMEQTSLASSKPATKDTFQVKSGIWADSLSRGLIDLNITARKVREMTRLTLDQTSMGKVSDIHSEDAYGRRGRTDSNNL